MKARTLLFVVILLLSGLSLCLTEQKTAYGSDFPSRPVEIIINFAPGGTLDLAVRIMSDDLSKSLGVPVMLTNKGGGGGATGTEYVARTKPDGYTILASPIGVFNILPFLTPNLHYKASDFIPLCKYAVTHNLILVRKASPYKTLADLVADAKQNPGKRTYASPGMATTSHIAMELLKIQAGIDISHLPYKSGGEVITSLLGGQVDFASQGLPSAMGLLRNGDLRALASSFGKIAGFPDIPSMEELGYPKPPFVVWVGYFLPKGTPAPIVDKLAAAFAKTIKNPAVKKNLEDSGQMLDYQEGPAFAKFMAKEYTVLGDLLKKAKLVK